jgi:hypothetical protein
MVQHDKTLIKKRCSKAIKRIVQQLTSTKVVAKRLMAVPQLACWCPTKYTCDPAFAADSTTQQLLGLCHNTSAEQETVVYS